MNQVSRCVTAFCLAFSAVPSAASPQPLVQSVQTHRNDIGEIEKLENRFVHRSSQFVFPMMLGEMPARKTVTFGPNNASINYTLYGGGNDDAWMDVYVYPAVLDPGAEKADIEAALTTKLNAKPSDAPAGLQPGPNGSMTGWYHAALNDQEILTGYRVVKVGDWYLKARISIPVKGGTSAEERAKRALQSIPWQQQLLPSPKTAAAASSSEAQ